MRRFAPALAILASLSWPALSRNSPAPALPPAPPSPIEGKLIECVADYAESHYAKPGDSFELGTAVLQACRAEADAVVEYNIRNQANVGGLRRTSDTEANNENTKAAVYFQAQRYATMRIIQRRSEARKTKNGP